MVDRTAFTAPFTYPLYIHKVSVDLKKVDSNKTRSESFREQRQTLFRKFVNNQLGSAYLSKSSDTPEHNNPFDAIEHLAAFWSTTRSVIPASIMIVSSVTCFHFGFVSRSECHSATRFSCTESVRFPRAVHFSAIDAKEYSEPTEVCYFISTAWDYKQISFSGCSNFCVSVNLSKECHRVL